LPSPSSWSSLACGGGSAAESFGGDLGFSSAMASSRSATWSHCDAGGFVAGEFQVRAGDDQAALRVGGRLRSGVGFVRAVPALADLLLPQLARAWRRPGICFCGRCTAGR
jgi:hypothetical protein